MTIIFVETSQIDDSFERNVVADDSFEAKVITITEAEAIKLTANAATLREVIR